MPFVGKRYSFSYWKGVLQEQQAFRSPRWHLTPRGFLVSNQIIGGMLDALAAEKRRRAEATARGDFRVKLD